MELLVVIAIISVLAAMLLPSLATALFEARLVSCMNNQKQNYLATAQYCADFKDMFPPWAASEGWAPMSASGLVNCQLGKVYATGYLGNRETLLDPDFFNDDPLNYRGTLSFIVKGRTVDWTKVFGCYVMYLWNGYFAKARCFAKPIAYTSAVTMCRIDSLSYNTFSHERESVNCVYLDGHARRLNGVAASYGNVCSESRGHGNASSYGSPNGTAYPSWWTWARDMDRK